jgi:flagellar protein FliS
MSNMTSSEAQRARFLNDTVLSASPARLLTMLYDRLVLDLDRGAKAQTAGDIQEANRQLTHAQDIVAELLVTLDADAWPGGAGLKALYSHLISELVQANVTHDAARTQRCREVVEPLRNAWHEAAAELGGAPPPRAAPATAGAPVSGGVLGVG